MSSMGGFKVPILHGMCTFGISGKHVLQKYGNNDSNVFKSIKCRLASPVFPGETLETQMWKEGSKIIFQTRVVERDVICINSAAVELKGTGSSATPKTTTAPSGSLKVAGFQASAVFEQLKSRLDSASPAERQAQVKKVKGSFQVDIMNAENKKQSWYIDFKTGDGVVGVGPSPKKTDVIITVSDSDFLELASGKLNAQKAFMAGKLKIKGNMMLATKLGDVLAGGKTKAKL
ncbi:4400_t:CDS:2 [Acaulospora colombiana]|uniref:4400_t:CDS:1 n=1 Tax=Acaulospora colombiana TaxID=27376 RepID=A0ACA9MKH0_9GLOM|nr:4400_t:CDS:2 [Acaulospora colombiana]